MSKQNQNEQLNKLLSGRGSISELTSLAKNLDKDHLQKAVPFSEYARVEWERRLNDKKWFEKPIGIIVLGIVIAVLGSLVFYLLVGQK